MSHKTSPHLRGAVPAACLVLAALACQTISGSTSTPVPTPTQKPRLTGTATPRPTETPPVRGAELLSDDFASERWGTGTDQDSAIEYAEGALQFTVFTKSWFAWSTPNEEIYQDVHIEVTAINNNTDSSTAFGIMCNQQSLENSYHYFAVTPSGEYAIARATADQTDVFLTNDDEWAASDLIARNAASYRLGADCGNGALTLYVDGQRVDSVSDTTYASGGVALFVWSGREATNTNVAFDDFVMTALP